jgi:hypothetical protein
MAEKGKPKEEEAGEGAPLWIISFADMISLLMAFFVMLSSFSSYGPRESERLRTVAKMTLLPNFGWHARAPQSAFQPSSAAAGESQAGSEKPGLETTSNNKSMKETYLSAYKDARVFVIESSKMFYAKGRTLSADGKRLLDTMAAYFGKMPGQIVVCERGPDDDLDLGIARSIEVVSYLQQRGIPKGRCNITQETMLEGNNAIQKRQLEIVLADEVEYK